MKTIYLDSAYKCHLVDDGTRQAVETDVFDGKCDVYIEGYRFVPSGSTWERGDGVTFTGEMVAPWKPWEELDAVQRRYEQAQMAEYEAAMAEIEEALGVSE